MSQQPEVKAAIISSKIRSLDCNHWINSGLLVAILTPYVTKWANRPEPTLNQASLAIEQIPQKVAPFVSSEYEPARYSCSTAKIQRRFVSFLFALLLHP